MDPGALDLAVRMRAFDFLREQCDLLGDELPFEVLRKGFLFDGHRVPLLSPQGIFKPAILPELPLSFVTAPPTPGKPRPYEDAMGSDGTIHYRYRGTDPMHPDNVRMRLAMTRGVPLIYLFGLVPGLYTPIWPVYVVGDDPSTLCFDVLGDEQRAIAFHGAALTAREPVRAYVTREVQQRLHQQAFAARVLQAYRVRCAMCRLGHRELLDAAHILPDRDPRGAPVVPNGIALCKLHHASFDANLVGITPEYQVVVTPRLLEEEDGPMLVHGLQQLHEAALQLPRERELRPNPLFLEERFEAFRNAM